ncbi:uncharacterized protein BO88DRAFT_427237 [Aspergillus vadensis CBS 113365]|uniref:HMG box domain-containing protein n=1 Tax=Aspergillus vadensis (strain CBS 113365 / IMI 142717 / IBT 24658) TaxID=1448311 RepID=A0A319B3E2_ASPVC|nr:hypothetical protein BO88DRAFT_427237 [Aspergillus vadensis CBS 113365]PYH67029.1 hypothetical protein BO88DRAFT_427237 [Aspergillus vadensis CBS 113365]
MSDPSADVTGSTPNKTGAEISALVSTTSRGLSFNQPVPMPEFAANNPYFVVPQPVNLFPTPPQLEDAAYQLDLRNQSLCRNTRLRRSNRAVATTRNNHSDHVVISRKDLDLPCPLSARTNGMQHIPVRDMYAWVHCPVETRRQEARQQQGRIPRPPNPFILWKMEVPHIRKKYKTLAVMEKRNHVRAHPGYRFPLNPGGFGPLQSAASVWWQRTIYSQMACTEQVSAGTQPCVPVVTGQPGMPDSACFVPQSGCSGLEAVSGQSALLTLSVTCEDCKVDGELAARVTQRPVFVY